MNAELGVGRTPRRTYSEEELALRTALDLAPQYNSGEVYAKRFEEALEELKTEGKIDGFAPTAQNSDDDRHGIDYWVEIDGEKIPFQISSGRQQGSGITKETGKKRTGRYGARKTEYIKDHNIVMIYLRKRRKLEFKDLWFVKEAILKGIDLNRTRRDSTI